MGNSEIILPRILLSSMDSGRIALEAPDEGIGAMLYMSTPARRNGSEYGERKIRRTPEALRTEASIMRGFLPTISDI
ncbi:MAG: hypothetical protein DSO07_12615 [Thermoproteota archaeon]|nr:MAG: hypothetical protein DSO07_12615 [Candidatus Korarchaeota archaeon]